MNLATSQHHCREHMALCILDRVLNPFERQKYSIEPLLVVLQQLLRLLISQVNDLLVEDLRARRVTK